eukprot:CAMPEP_0170131352 /NCGR_PEP_ID=MMETSP0020_2-20130122/23194_1 /TAXON_ID=98059 /ORGANISM="Dinobryon sp., Strain UTEXLB2267" /LENGTH=42 /DNA_ID= /DNA_START= /DNA_END= /DNA_ORIENTATION=
MPSMFTIYSGPPGSFSEPTILSKRGTASSLNSSNSFLRVAMS